MAETPILKRPAVRLAVLGIALLGSAGAFYFMAPVFVREPALSSYPSLSYMPTRTPQPPTATTAPTEIPTDTATPVIQASLFELVSAELIFEGQFMELSAAGQGSAAIYQNDDGELVLMLDDFEVEEGPDLHIYLAAEGELSADMTELPEAIDLGALLAFSGDQSYEIPADLAMDEYQSVVIWCETYDEPYLGAPLLSPN